MEWIRRAEGFNSLFEMPFYYFPADAIDYEKLVSILYLRCAVGPRHGISCGRFDSFNSLFEMRKRKNFFTNKKI